MLQCPELAAHDMQIRLKLTNITNCNGIVMFDEVFLFQKVSLEFYSKKKKISRRDILPFCNFILFAGKVRSLCKSFDILLLRA